MSDVFWAAFGGGAAAGIFTLLALGFAEWLRWFLDRPLIRVTATLGIVIQDAVHPEEQSILMVNNPRIYQLQRLDSRAQQ